MVGGMARLTLLAVAVVTGALVSGCGGAGSTITTTSSTPPAPAGLRIETTGGRLGGAVTVAPGRPQQRLAPAGRPDLRPRRDRPRRDGVGAGAVCAGPDAAPAPATLAAVTETTLCLLNGERADRGLPALTANPALASAATAYAGDLVAGSYFSHTGRDGSTLLDRIRRVGYVPDDRPWRLGENLAWGTGVLAAPGAIVLAWMNSPGHRENILDPGYREIGIGIVPGNPQRADGAGASYVTEFGALGPAPAARPAAAVSAPPSAARALRRKQAQRRKRAKRAHSTRHHRHGKPRGRAARGPKAHIAM